MEIKQLEELQRKFRRRPVATVASLLVLAFLAGIGVWLSSFLEEKGKQVAAIADPAKPTIAQVLVASAEERNRLEITVQNPLSSDIIIKNITLTARRYDDEHEDCLGSGSITFSLHDTIEIFSSPTGIEFGGMVRTDSASEYAYPVYGRYHDNGCDRASFTLELRSSIQLSRSSVNRIEFIVPRKMTSHLEFSSPPISPEEKVTLDLLQYDSVVVELEFSGGEGLAEAEWVNLEPKHLPLLRLLR